MNSSRLTTDMADDWLSAMRHTANMVEDSKILPMVLGEFRKQNPFICEEIILRCFWQAGFAVHKPKGYTGDGGIDGVCIMEGCRFPVQVKRYQGHVNLSHIEEFTALIRRQRVSNPSVVAGFFVHSGKTGATSKAVINYGQEIILISGSALVHLLLDPIAALDEILGKYYDKSR
jgi:restriction system protein